MSVDAQSGVLIGVGVGPGDPELMTLRAYRLISGAEVVAYPAPLGPGGEVGESFARAVAADAIAEDAEEIPIPVPMSGERAPAQVAYDQAAAAIAQRLAAGADVVLLCEGDPLFYGSYMYLLARLGARFETETCPGVCSLTACAAALQRPLSARDETLVVLPATLDEALLEARLVEIRDCGGAAAILKVGRRLARVKDMIGRLGLLARAGYVGHASLPTEVAVPLAEAPEQAPYFSMILIRGEDPFAHG